MFVNKKDCAKFLGVSFALVDKLVQKKEIPFHKIGTAVRFDLKEVEEWAKKDKTK